MSFESVEKDWSPNHILNKYSQHNNYANVALFKQQLL